MPRVLGDKQKNMDYRNPCCEKLRIQLQKEKEDNKKLQASINGLFGENGNLRALDLELGIGAKGEGDCASLKRALPQSSPHNRILASRAQLKP